MDCLLLYTCTPGGQPGFTQEMRLSLSRKADCLIEDLRERDLVVIKIDMGINREDPIPGLQFVALVKQIIISGGSRIKESYSVKLIVSSLQESRSVRVLIDIWARETDRYKKLISRARQKDYSFVWRTYLSSAVNFGAIYFLVKLGKLNHNILSCQL